MFKGQCLNCKELNRCKDSFTYWIFFIIGLIATISMRIVTVMTDINPLYGKITWYLGVLGFFLFFIYQYRIYKSRNKLIIESKITEKTASRLPLEPSDYDLLQYVLCSLSKTKETFNYLFIFASSCIALATALYFDIFK